MTKKINDTTGLKFIGKTTTDNGCIVEFFLDEKTNVTRMKVTGPTPEIEEEVGKAMLELMTETSKVLGQEIKVLRQEHVDDQRKTTIND